MLTPMVVVVAVGIVSVSGWSSKGIADFGVTAYGDAEAAKHMLSREEDCGISDEATCTVDDGTSFLQNSLSVYDSTEAEEAKYVLNPRTLALTELIAKVYYINLDGSVERRAAMESQLADLERATGLPYERFPAINGTIDPWVQNILHNQTVLNTRAESPGAGTLGCMRSHMELWRKIFASDSPDEPHYSLILEDDVLLNATMMSSLPTRLLEVPEDHHMVLLDHWGLQRDSDQVGDGVYRANLPFVIHGFVFYYAGTHAYLIRHTDLGRLADWVETRAPSWAMDYATAYNTTGVHKYSFFPVLVGQPEDRAETEEIRDMNHPESGG